MLLRSRLSELATRCLPWLVLGFLTLPSTTAQEPSPAELLVLPGDVQVSREYPAQVVVLLRLADGTLLDCTRDPATTYSLGENRQAFSIDQRGLIAATGSSSSTVLSVTYGDLQATCQVTINREAASPTFAREISAILGKSGCNQGTCHGNLHGKGGLRFSLRGDDPCLDFESIVRDSGGRRVDSYSAELSLILRKTTGRLAHQGGVRFTPDSQAYRWLQQWIEDGCRWNASATEPPTTGRSPTSPAEKLVRLRVHPDNALLSERNRAQQLVVLAQFEDGAVRDVTRWARYEPSLVSGIEVSKEGLVRADRASDVSVSISYLAGRCASRLTFLPARGEAWDETPPPTQLDALVENQLKRMRLEPAHLADDSVFMRRAYLTIVGRLPSPEAARSFIDSERQDKRERLIESLLYDPGYAMLWALRWSDLLRNEQKVMSSRGAQQWYAWLAEQMSQDRPLNQMVYDLVASVGSTYDNPPASFHRTHREPELAAETIGQVFLGVRLQCARCHNHPFDAWRQDDYYGLAAYFTTVQRKQIDNAPKDKFDKHIISGDETISLAKGPAKIWHPGRAADVAPKPLTEPLFADIATQADGKSGTPLEQLAIWLTRDNRLFARNMANRIWYHFMGRGIVDPPDDFRDSNPPTNPELLEYLTDELIRSDYSVRHVARLILQSRTFARQAFVSELHSAPGLDGEALFAGYPLRRMPAEVLYDAIGDATGVVSKQDSNESPTVSQQRAIAQADTPTRANFLTAFGKPDRLLVCECERSSEVSLGQSLLLVNGVELRQLLAQPDNRLGQLLSADLQPAETIEELYLSVLARRPLALEQQQLLEYIEQAANRRAAYEDLLWALINSKEFVLIR